MGVCSTHSIVEMQSEMWRWRRQRQHFFATRVCVCLIVVVTLIAHTHTPEQGARYAKRFFFYFLLVCNRLSTSHIDAFYIADLLPPFHTTLICISSTQRQRQ